MNATTNLRIGRGWRCLNHGDVLCYLPRNELVRVEKVNNDASAVVVGAYPSGAMWRGTVSIHALGAVSE